MRSLIGIIVASMAFATVSLAQPGRPGGASEPLDWKNLESVHLSDHVQLTFREDFLKAGEGYFDPTSSWIIFQAVPAPAAGEEPDEYYSMYVAKLTRADGKITGTEKPILVSPPGSSNTCGWFHPTQRIRVMFGSTIVPPAKTQKTGFQVDTRKYMWMFPEEMEIVSRTIPEIYDDLLPAGMTRPHVDFNADVEKVVPIFRKPNYDAEASWSSDGRYILYTHVRDELTEGRPDADIWVYDTELKRHTELVTAAGYDGGPFFSADGKKICYRSDRRLDDRLQVFVSELAFQGGTITGITRETAVTDDEHVNWAPFFHPSGNFIVFGSSMMGHHNYEVIAIEVNTSKTPDQLVRKRITLANGADVMPVFNADGSLMMWTSQRAPKGPDDDRPKSQLWVAQFKGDPLR